VCNFLLDARKDVRYVGLRSSHGRAVVGRQSSVVSKPKAQHWADDSRPTTALPYYIATPKFEMTS
jgi:hypothetical protein